METREGGRLRVAVLMGGRSGEHDVSLASGRAALAALPRERFDAFAVVLGRDGRWRFPATGNGAVPPDEPGLALADGLRALLERAPAVAFVAMHGPEGEDGKLQSLLELAGLPYTGSDPYASSLAMNKPIAKHVLRAAGIPVAADRVLALAEWRADRDGVLAALLCSFPGPWVLKTPKLGSSVGLDIVRDPAALPEALDALFALDRAVLVEEFVAGRELTGGVLDWPALGGVRALPLVEITPVAQPFFNYHAKYTVGAAREVCPAPVDAATTARVQDLSVRAHRALACRGFSRTDFILRPDGGLVCLETNTIPGLTQTSLLPQAAAAAGIPFPALVAGMVEAALQESLQDSREGADRSGLRAPDRLVVPPRSPC